MNVTLSANGVLHVKADNSIEEYALTQWLNAALIQTHSATPHSATLNEACLIRGSRINIHLSQSVTPWESP